MEKSETKALFLPGLDGIIPGNNTLNEWEKRGIPTAIHPLDWRSKESYTAKRDRLFTAIDRSTSNGERLIIEAVSAGAHAGLEVLLEFGDRITALVLICGRLKPPTTPIGHAIAWALRSRSYYESLQQAPANVARLTETDLGKIITYTSRFDELVPGDTALIPGTRNFTIPRLEHITSIKYVMNDLQPDIIAQTVPSSQQLPFITAA